MKTGKGKRKKQKIMEHKEPKVMSEKTLEFQRKLWGLKSPTLDIKLPRTRSETFRELKAGELELKHKHNREIFVEYESEATEDAVKREESKYIKDPFKKVLRKRLLKKKHLLIKGYDIHGNIEYWKAILKKRPKKEEKPYETPLIYESVLSNSNYRINNALQVIAARHERRNLPLCGETGLLDRMSDEFLSLFHENSRNEDGKKRRYTALEFVNMDPDTVCEIIKPFRTPIMNRLKKFEEERNERKRATPMLENEKQKYVRKIKANEAKKRCLELLLTYLQTNLDKGKQDMIVEEGIKYKHELNEFKKAAKGVFQSILKEMELYSQALIKKEVKDALNLRRQALEEEIMTTATHRELEFQDNYENFLLPAKLSDQKESYQLDMSSYVEYWAKKTGEIEKEVAIQKQYLERQFETTKILQIIEHLPSVRKLFSENAKEGKHQIKDALMPLREKVETLENLCKENQQLVGSIKYYEHAIPEFIRKLKELIELTKNQCEERERFLQALDTIDKFRCQLIKQGVKVQKLIEYDSAHSEDNISKTKSEISIIKKTELKDDEEAVFDLTHRFLSDGDLEENTKHILKVKFIISDLLKKVIPLPILKCSEERVKEIKFFSGVETATQNEDETYITKSRRKVDSFPVLDKLLEVNEKLDLIFQIVGEKYSMPDLVKVGEYLNKRTASVDKILEKHQEMLGNALNKI